MVIIDIFKENQDDLLQLGVVHALHCHTELGHLPAIIPRLVAKQQYCLVAVFDDVIDGVQVEQSW